MKRFLMTSLLLLLASLSLSAADGHSSRIKWLTNYDEALQLSSKSTKPIILFFTGSDWCSWCIKLENEALGTQEFADVAEDKFIFVKLDFPLNRQSPQDLSTQNKHLQKQFGVNGFPSIVIIDANQKQIGTAGYRQGGGKQYALYLLKLVNDQGVYNQKIENIQQQKLSSSELKQLYERALACGLNCDFEKIINAGVKTDQKVFF